MSIIAIAIVSWIVLLFAQLFVTGEFLKHLEQDNKTKFDEIWAESEQAWNYLIPVRIGWLYALPGTFKLWELSERGRRSAEVLRIVSILSAIALLAIPVALLVDLA